MILGPLWLYNLKLQSNRDLSSNFDSRAKNGPYTSSIFKNAWRTFMIESFINIAYLSKYIYILYLDQEGRLPMPYFP